MSGGPFTELRVVTTAGWLARDLRGGSVVPVVHDLGLDVPADTRSTAWWCPHQHVARLAVTPGVTQPVLWSPGPRWLTRVAPQHLRRRVWAGPLRDVPASSLWAAGGSLFAKPAEIKVRGLEAAAYPSAEAVTRALRDRGLSSSSTVVLSEVVRFVEEFRCFVAPGPGGRPRVVAASAYLVDGLTWDAWEGSASAPDPSEAVTFAGQVVDATSGPPGFVLDVGRLEDGSWAVVEANASWSSSPYHCDPVGVVASVLAAQGPGGAPAWAWSSDPYMDRFARPLPVRSD